MKCWTGSYSGRISPVTLELHALEWWKKNNVHFQSDLLQTCLQLEHA